MTSQVLIALITSVIGPAVMVFLQQRMRRDIQSVSDRTDEAVRELTPNHGSSAKDQLTRIEAQQAEHGRALTRVEQAQGQTSRDIGGLREEIRTEREERRDLAARVGTLEHTPRTRP